MVGIGIQGFESNHAMQLFWTAATQSFGTWEAHSSFTKLRQDEMVWVCIFDLKKATALVRLKFEMLEMSKW